MDFGIFLDFQVRRGGTQEEAYKETFDLVGPLEVLSALSRLAPSFVW